MKVKKRTHLLEKAKEELKHFISTAAHELRTPTYVVLQALDNLNEFKDKISKEKKLKLKENIYRNANLLSELIENLLITSRIEEKRIILIWKDYSPSIILNTILKQMEPRRAAKKITISVDVDPELRLNGDQDNV